MKYITEYQPQISEECKTFIYKYIDPTFVYDDNGTQMYSLEYVHKSLSDEIKEAGEEVHGIKMQDLSVLKSLIDENVSYIEF
jgi:EAL domain-containing protein (putative c-di-GMP-specific phosphodiesterase class I)